MDLAHVAFWVADIDRSLAFYEAIGFERSWSFTADGVENVYVTADAGELQLRHDPNRTTPIAPSRADTDHVAFAFDDPEDVDALLSRARENGGSVVADSHVVGPADAYAAFVEDPDGHTLELLSPLEGQDD